MGNGIEYILGIDTSCDDTSVSIVKNGSDILCNFVRSQTEVHINYGGIYPDIAGEYHVGALSELIRIAINTGKVDAIAATMGPGLIGSILMGVTAARTLSQGLHVPFIGVNHIEAHIYSSMMNNPLHFPSIGLVVSGGHTILAEMSSILNYKIVGKTADDAAGEAFDKVAIMIGGYGGEYVEKQAITGDPYKYPFRAGVVKRNPLYFSFSGLKTWVKRTVTEDSTQTQRADIAASFQRAVAEDLVDKIHKAAKQFDCRAVYISGGVSHNDFLRKHITSKTTYPVFFPEKNLTRDNAAMVAGLAYHMAQDPASHIPIINPFPKLETTTCLVCDRTKNSLGIAAAKMVTNGLIVGLGTGSTAFYMIKHIAKKVQDGNLSISVIPTSIQSQELAIANNLKVLDVNQVDSIDLTIDGADQIDPHGNLIKGGGGALLREKIVAAMSKSILIIADGSKLVPSLDGFKLPIEIINFGKSGTERILSSLGFHGSYRKNADNSEYLSDNGNPIYDITPPWIKTDLRTTDQTLLSVPGVIATGLFYGLNPTILIGDGERTYAL